jgi:hypothetical protein
VANETKLIWRGAPKCRSLATRSPSGVRFYLEGEEIPAGLISPTLEETMVADGRIERTALPGVVEVIVTTDPLEQASAPATVEPTISQVSAPVPSDHVSARVGVMEVRIDAGADGQLGTDDDLREIFRRAAAKPIAKTEPVDIGTTPNTEADKVPDSAPTRKRHSTKRKK